MMNCAYAPSAFSVGNAGWTTWIAFTSTFGIEHAAAQALYALIRMHGTAIALKDGTSAPLLAGYANKHGVLEVKVQIEFSDGPKPISAPVCLFDRISSKASM
jgi:hypothetical protein